MRVQDVPLGRSLAAAPNPMNFNMLGLHNVMLTVLPTNTAAIRTYEKAGFKRIGVRRDSLSVLGRRGDEVLMDAVASEFDSPVLAARR